MNQVKIGRFIAECRKEKNVTQRQLADILEISDKTISKWETGKGLPEVDLMLPLCEYLGITVNELLSGEKILENEYQQRAENNLVTLMKEQEYSEDYKPLIGWIISFTVTALFFGVKLEASGNSPQLIRIMIAITMVLIDVLFTIIYQGEYVYWIVYGPKYEIAKNVDSITRKQYAWKYLKRFLVASVVISIYLIISMVCSFPVKYDLYMYILIMVITAFTTIRIKF